MMFFLIIAVVTVAFLCLIIGADAGSARTFSEMAARHHAIESSRIMAEMARDIVSRRSLNAHITRLIGGGGN